MVIRRRAVSGIALMLLLVGILILTFSVQPAKGEPGTIYVRADGSVDPPTANITTVDNVTYTFTDNNYDSIWVERSNIIVDGNGYTLQGAGTGDGFRLYGIDNVTIKNTTIKLFSRGIWLRNSFNSTISGNHITENNWLGIHKEYSSNSTISGNNITNNELGIWLYYSSNSTISRNVFVNDGLFVHLSYENLVWNNTVNGKPLVYLEGVSDIVVEDAGQVVLLNSNRIVVKNLNLSNTDVGITLLKTNNAQISGNNITNNEWGIRLEDSSINNTISGNNITENNQYGLIAYSSTNNTISGNNVANNRCGFWLRYSSNSTISRNNVANNVEGITLQYSSNNIISGNNIANNEYGILFTHSSDNTISGNNITENSELGIRLDMYDSNNIISGNNIANNEYGVWLRFSSNNLIYHNNFINNIYQVYIDPSGYTHLWDNDYPSGGNYWSDYAGVDVKSGPNQDQPGSDGIGDTPYIIDENNQDKYPLMEPWPCETGPPPIPAVGGVYIPVNKLELWTPYIGLMLLLAAAAVTVVYVKKRKER